MTTSPEPKYRVVCVTCGRQSPRPVTSWTARNWMVKHDEQHHDEGASR